MDINEIATKADIEAMKKEIIAIIKSAVKPSGQNLLSLEQACEYLGGMAIATLRHKASTYEIASHKCGKRLAFRQADLDEYLSRTRRRSEAELRETL